MEDWQKRVLAEKEELDAKSERLRFFLNSTPLPDAEYERMSRQLRIMREYSGVLEERISAWSL